MTRICWPWTARRWGRSSGRRRDRRRRDRRRRAEHRRAGRRGDRRARSHRDAGNGRHPPAHVGGNAPRRRLLRRPPRLLRQGRVLLRRGLYTGGHVHERAVRARGGCLERDHEHARLGAQHPDPGPRAGGAPGHAGVRAARPLLVRAVEQSRGWKLVRAGQRDARLRRHPEAARRGVRSAGSDPPRHRLPRARVLA